MEDFIWDKVKNCSWKELENFIVSLSEKFSSTILETVSLTTMDEIAKQINSKSLDRFCLMAKSLSIEVTKGVTNEFEDLGGDAHDASKLVGWILLGSLTETVLQIFLTVYIDDYHKSLWKQWVNFPEAIVKSKIGDTISELELSGIIDKVQSKALKKGVKNNISYHCSEHIIYKMSLSELISYYEEHKLLDSDDLQNLSVIQRNRNIIHSFENKEINDWNDLKYSVKFWCYLLEWILFRLPSVSDYF